MAKKNSGDFPGFPAAMPGFFSRLGKNNNRDWFKAHKQQYDELVLAPAQHFVVALGERLERWVPDIIANPGVIGGSIFRIQRDTRFSKDKTPYKTWVAFRFRDGSWPKEEAPGFFMRLDGKTISLYCGTRRFSKGQLAAYREALATPAGARLAGIVKKISARKGYDVRGHHYKRRPAGFDVPSPVEPLLLHNSLYAVFDGDAPKTVHSPRLVDYCAARFDVMRPVLEWLRENRAPGGK